VFEPEETVTRRAQVMNAPDALLKKLVEISDEPGSPWLQLIREELRRRRDSGVAVNEEHKYVPHSNPEATQAWRMRCPSCKSTLINMSHMVGCPMASNIDLHEDEDEDHEPGPNDTPLTGSHVLPKVEA
jgi:hypothetical protein